MQSEIRFYEALQMQRDNERRIIMRRKKWIGLCLTVICLNLGLLSANASEDSVSEQMKSRMAFMTREEKAGQMLMVSPSQLCSDADWTENIDMVLQNVELYHVGSLIFFEEDLSAPDAVVELTAALRERDGIPVLTAADVSGSLENGFTKPNDTAQLTVSGFDQDAGCWAYGLTEGLPDELRDMGISLAVSAGDGTDFAVVTHARIGGSELSSEMNRPASMTKGLISELKSGFSGIVLTDSLSMPDAARDCSADMAVMYALQAGADILTAPANLTNAYYGILSAIDEQMVTEEQINASVLKILDTKKRLGLME